MVLLRDVENIVDRTRTNDELLITISKWQLKSSKIHNEENRLGKLNTHKTHRRQRNQKKTFFAYRWRNKCDKKKGWVIKGKVLLRATKHRKLWGAVVVHVIEQHGVHIYKRKKRNLYVRCRQKRYRKTRIERKDWIQLNSLSKSKIHLNNTNPSATLQKQKEI